LPAFAGHVPAAITTKFPNAKINKLGFWGDFRDQYRAHFLDPLDPLFPKIQKAFMEEQTRQFGTDHIYGTDPFNEIHPPSWEPDYLAKVGETIYQSMAAVDPDAQWLQMTWVFYFDRKNWTNERIKAMVRSVPQDKMILLDYYCENQEVWKMTEKFFGQPYLWCYLGNFGGNTMLVGNLAEVEKRIENTFANGGDKVWGLGSTLEALDTNPVMYDYLFEKAWSTGPTDIGKWIADYGASRNGDTPAVRDAWKKLLEKVYVAPSQLGQGTLTNARPWFKGQGQWTTNPSIKYANKDLLAILDQLLSTPLPGRDSYRYDVVNLCRQVIGNHFSKLREQFTTACEAKDMTA
ncbi:MAG: alpha-N-acetylglucosaminidase, partial [Verrucomicrobiaceae bacterium]